MNILRNWRQPLLAAAALAALLLIAPTSGFAETPSSLEKVNSIEGVTEYHMPNGLRILLCPDPAAAKVSVICTVFVGSRDEGHGETGMAHLLEHMNIKCTATRANIKKELGDRGASWNATTSKDRTNYFETLTATDDNLEFAIGLEADRLINCPIRREDLMSEMTVVRNEFELYENAPAEILGQRLFAVAYEWHNYGKAIIGNRSDIERVNADHLRAFYKKHYRPDNAMLIVAGKFNEKKALDSIVRHFGPLKNPPTKLARLRSEEPAQDGERNLELRRVGTTGKIVAAYHIPAAAHPDFAALTVLAQVLATEPHGRLYKTFVATKKSSGVGASALPMGEPSLFLVGAQVDQGQSADDIRRTLLDTVEGLAADKFTDAEIQHARAELTSGWEKLTCFNIADGLCEWAGRGDWRLLFLHRDRLANVTREDVHRVAGKYLVRTNRTVGTYVPTEKPERAEVPETPAIAVMLKDYKGSKTIAAGEEFDPTPENIDQRVRRHTLPSGVKAALLPRKTRGEMVSLQLTLRYGNEQSLAGLREACDYLPVLMRRGTKKHDFQAFDLELPKLGNANISMSGGVGSVTLYVQCQRQHLPKALALAAEMLREPTLPQEEFETLKRATIEAIRGQLKEPGSLALQALRRKLHPHDASDLRYVSTFEELIAAYEGTTIDQVRKVYTEQLGGTNGELVVVGDFDAEAVLRQVQEMLAGWKSPVNYVRIATPPNTKVAGSYDVIRTADKANAFYRAAHMLVQRQTDPDYPALLVGNYILGNSSASRLWTRIREKEGLSYDVSSSFNAGSLDPEAYFEFSAICNPTNIAKVRTAMAEEIAGLLERGVTQKELDAAKTAILTARRTFTDGEIVGTLAGNLFDGDSLTAYAERSKKIGELTVEQVNAALRTHLQPKKLVIVEAGDFEPKAAATPMKAPGNP